MLVLVHTCRSQQPAGLAYSAVLPRYVGVSFRILARSSHGTRQASCTCTRMHAETDESIFVGASGAGALLRWSLSIVDCLNGHVLRLRLHPAGFALPMMFGRRCIAVGLLQAARGRYSTPYQMQLAALESSILSRYCRYQRGTCGLCTNILGRICTFVSRVAQSNQLCFVHHRLLKN